MSFIARGLLKNSLKSVDLNSFQTTGTAQANFFKIAISSNGQYITATRANSNQLFQLYMTSDGGNTWSFVDPSVAGFDIGIAANNGLLQAAADYNNGYIYTTTNAWQTYTQKTAVGASNWGCLKMSYNGQVIVAGSWGGKVVVSTNGGATWSSKIVPNYQYYNAGITADGTKMILGGWSTGGVIISTDSGTSFSPISLFSGLDVRSVAVTHDGSTFYAAGYNFFYKSTDNGASWQQLSTRSAFDLACCLSDNNLILSTSQGVSVNGGTSFTAFKNVSGFVRGVAMTPDGVKRVCCVASTSDYIYKNF